MAAKEEGFILITVISFLFFASLLFLTYSQAVFNDFRLQDLLVTSYIEKTQEQIANKKEPEEIPEEKKEEQPGNIK